MLISAFVILIVVCIVTTTLPVYGVQRTFYRSAEPILRATALQQNWSVFAPDPRQRELEAWVVLHYRDGTTWTWRAPSGGPLVSPARDYRWRKWLERTFLPENPRLEQLTARWAARQAPRPGAVSATVFRAVAPIPPPGRHSPGSRSVTQTTVALPGSA
jgi:hypothetical protein